MNKTLPWTLCVLLAAALGGTVVYYQGALKDKDAAFAAAGADLEAAKTKLGEANTRAEQSANVARAKMQELTEVASRQLAAANLPEANVVLAVRKAMLSSGNVITLRNTVSQPIAIKVTAARPSANQQKAFQLTLDGQRTAEIGANEGWAFISGDTVSVEQPNHKAKSYTLP